MTVLAVALGRYPFVTPNSARSLSHSGEVITEGDGGYWAILQAIQERPSIRSLLASCQHHCEHHSHSSSGTPPDSSPTATTAAPSSSPPLFSKAFHSFLSQCLQKDPKQRPTAQALLQHPFLLRHPLAAPVAPSSATAPALNTATATASASLTNDFICHCCSRHKTNMEAKAVSARNRLGTHSLFAASSAEGVSLPLPLLPLCEVPRSGEKTADNNAAPRNRRARGSKLGGLGGLAEGAQPLDISTPLTAQDEGVQQLRTVVKAYREYLNRAWGRRTKTTGTTGNDTGSTGEGSISQLVSSSHEIGSSQSAENIILTTLAPLYSRGVLVDLAEALNVPLSVVKKSFQKVVRELKEHLCLSTSLPLEGEEEIKSTAATVRRSTETTGLRVSSERTVAVGGAVTEQGMMNEGKLDRSDGSDTAAVEELRALMSSRPTGGGGGGIPSSVQQLLNGNEDEDEDESSPRPPPEEVSEPFSARAVSSPPRDESPSESGGGRGGVRDDDSDSVRRRSWDQQTTAEEEEPGERTREQEEESEEEYADDYDDDFED
jgi:hypothetical protein